MKVEQSQDFERNRAVLLRLMMLLWAVSGTAGGHAHGQSRLGYGGYLEASAQVYPRTPNPADAHAVGEGRFQLWSRVKLSDHISWRGRVDFRLDTHLDVDRHEWTDLLQGGLRRPAGALTECYLDMSLGRLDLRAGTQEIRWGRADGFNPTDNLIPYDYLDTFDAERLAVPALKGDFYVGGTRFEAAWVPFYAPSRLPLLGQRWFPSLPATIQAPPGPGMDPTTIELTYQDSGGPLPARTFDNGQWGVRWNQLVPHAEFSFSYFDGFDDIAFFRPSPLPLSPPPHPRVLVSLGREYYRVRVAGADFASQLGPFGLRGEVAYFDQTDPANLDHLLYVVGLDRSWGDWFAIIQYAGQNVSGTVPDTAIFPDLALRSTILCRVERTLGPSRSIEVKGALRLRDGDFFVQPLYNVALANKWRLKIGATIFGGPGDEYFGQFRENGHLMMELRYTF